MNNDPYIETAERVARAINEMYTQVTIALQPLLRIEHRQTKETIRINQQYQRRQYTRAGRRKDNHE